MLERIATLVINEIVYRLANPPRMRAALAELGADREGVLETLDFLKTTGAEDVSVLLSAPFVDDPIYTPSPTRYSDGTWKVFYSALEPETCEAERAYWCFRNVQSDPPATRQFHYREFRCRLNGTGYDLRPMRDKWPFLTGDTSTYPKCQDVAREARTALASALLCPSARHKDGTTAPVFVREVLSDGTILGLVHIQIDANGRISISR
jgi:hypothetical protein